MTQPNHHRESVETLDQPQRLQPSRSTSSGSARLGATSTHLSRVDPFQQQIASQSNPTVLSFSSFSSSRANGTTSPPFTNPSSSGGGGLAAAATSNGDISSPPRILYASRSSNFSDLASRPQTPNATGFYQASFLASQTTSSNIALRYRKPFVHRVLAEGESPAKPWLDSVSRKKTDRKAYWLFVGTIFLGFLGAAALLPSPPIGQEAIVNGGNINLTQSNTCTFTNQSNVEACQASSNQTLATILPPIQSARLTTNFSRTIHFGKVQVKAKLPKGDWMWPAIWMMPKDNVYGDWPKSGEIDIVESKGNLPKTRSDANSNSIRSSLHFGPDWRFDGYGWATNLRNLWRNYYNQGYHTFGLEWTPQSIYTWERSPVYKVFEHKFHQPFWKLGHFPPMTQNGTVLTNPWIEAKQPNIAPFDQEFYLILNVAVGGTNGYFEDDKYPDKPWSNLAQNAKTNFWNARDKWLPTWPTDPKQ